MLRKAALLLVAVSLWAQRSHAQETNSTDIEELAEAISTFSFDVYKELHTESKNLLFSPFGAHAGLSMVMLGSQNMTLENFHHLLKTEDPYNGYIEVLENFEKVADMDVIMANSFWVKPSIAIKEEYKGHVEHIFQAEPYTIDMTAPKGPEDPINVWVANRTNQAITTILTPNTITTDTDILFLDVLHVNAPWAVPFDTSKTEKGDFTTESGEKAQTDFMKKDGADVEVGELDGFAAKMLRIPFKNFGFAFWIVLPYENETFSTLQEFMLKEFGDNEPFFMHTQKTKLNLVIPKFRLTSTININKKNSHGLDFLFDDSADFSDISEKHWKLSNAIHKVTIDVKESGTISSASPVIKDSPSPSSKSAEDFTVKRPFMFFVRDDVKGIILFQGKMSDPRVTEIEY